MQIYMHTADHGLFQFIMSKRTILYTQTYHWSEGIPLRGCVREDNWSVSHYRFGAKTVVVSWMMKWNVLSQLQMSLISVLTSDLCVCVCVCVSISGAQYFMTRTGTDWPPKSPWAGTCFLQSLKPSTEPSNFTEWPLRAKGPWATALLVQWLIWPRTRTPKNGVYFFYEAVA